MDPGQLAAELLNKNFDKFGSFLTQVTYSAISSASYNATTGVVTPGPDVDYVISVAMLPFSVTKNQSTFKYYDNEVIYSIDLKVLFPALYLPVVPKIGDFITKATGQVWKVIGVNSDPKPAHWNLHCRAQS